MGFVLQTDDGLLADDSAVNAEANAYISLTEMINYWFDRNVDLTNDDPLSLQAAIIKATDYVDNRFQFKGRRQQSAQPVQWPRVSIYDNEGEAVAGLPRKLKNAVAEYAYRARTAALDADPSIRSNVMEQKVKAGPVLESIRYGMPSSMPRYPIADRMLAGYVVTGGGSYR